MINRNVGGMERVIRIVVGLGVLSLVFVGPQTPWGYLGVILIATGLISWCPAWTLFGVNTCKTK